MKVNIKYRIKTYEIPDLARDEIDKVAKSYPIILSQFNCIGRICRRKY